MKRDVNDSQLHSACAPSRRERGTVRLPQVVTARGERCCSTSTQRRLASEAAKWVDGRPDASLEVSCPLQRSPATSRLCVPGGATSPAIPLRPLTRVVVLLRPWYAFARDASTVRCSCLRSRDTVHPRTGDAGCPCGFTLGGAGPVDSARIDAARFGRDASPFSSRRCIARVRARRESCAGAFFFSRRSATRGSGYVAWSGPFSAVEACLGFRPVNLAGNEAGLSSRV